MLSHPEKAETLVILSPGFPGDEQDTTCLPPIQQFCLVAKEAYPQLHLVVIAFQYPFRRDHYHWHGIEVVAIGGRNRNKLFRLITWIRVKKCLNKICRQKKVKGLLSLWVTETTLVGRSFAKAKKLKFYAWAQGQDAKKENGYVFRSGIKPSELIAISEFNAGEFEKNHRLKPFMIAANGVNKKVFPPFNAGGREIDIIGVGSLIPLKNHEAFVKTVHALKQKFPGIRAVLVGSGEEERKLTDLVNRLGLNHQLKLVGSLPHVEVLALMNRSRILLHPSSYEGMSTVMVEALYSGCRVVSFHGLGEAASKYLTVVHTEADLAPACSRILVSYEQTTRTLVYDMHETVRRIVGLYV